jgi:WD40 repeat protein
MSETPATNLSATQLRILFAHRGDEFYSVTWSPDSRMFATGSADNTIRLWDIESGELVRTLEGHQSAVRSVAWSGDGQWLASGANDQTVRVWDMESGTELAVYQSRYVAYSLLDISFVPDTPVLAVLGKTRFGDDDMLIETPGLELHTPTSILSPTSSERSVLRPRR